MVKRINKSCGLIRDTSLLYPDLGSEKDGHLDKYMYGKILSPAARQRLSTSKAALIHNSLYHFFPPTLFPLAQIQTWPFTIWINGCFAMATDCLMDANVMGVKPSSMSVYNYSLYLDKRGTTPIFAIILATSNKCKLG